MPEATFPSSPIDENEIKIVIRICVNEPAIVFKAVT
jgi:hypothetical protein